MVRFLPFIAAAAALFGAGMIRREWQRVNRDMDRVRDREPRPAGTLKQDEKTGEWRPSH
jgi:hypothetical protein